MKYRPHMAEDRVALSDAIEREIAEKIGVQFISVLTLPGMIWVDGGWSSGWIAMSDDDWTEEIAIEKILTRWVEYRVTGE